jgi:hypothetical protein
LRREGLWLPFSSKEKGTGDEFEIDGKKNLAMDEIITQYELTLNPSLGKRGI